MAKAKRKRSRPQPAAPKRSASSGGLVAVVFSGLLIYIVVKKVDDISGVSVAGTGIAFRGSASPSTMPADEQRQRSEQLAAQIEENVQEASPLETRPNAVELTGAWKMVDGTATWDVTAENGYLVFREQNVATPGIISAVGYGSFDGNSWSLQVQTIMGATGTASLAPQSDGTLQGEAEIAGSRFSIALQR